MDFHQFFTAIFTFLLGLLGFFMKSAHSKIEKNTEELSAFKTHVALEYPTKESINDRFDKVDQKLEKMLDKLDLMHK